MKTAALLTAVAAEGSLEQNLRVAIDALRPLHAPLPPPRPGDWLDQHPEAGQTFDEYVRLRPHRPVAPRRVIWVQPLGDLTRSQRRIVTCAVECLGRFYHLPARLAPDVPLRAVPPYATRIHPQWGMRQLLTEYLLDSVLRPRIPSDAAAYLAFTAEDLWPGEGWNFVFGQASLHDPVGVWSIHRNGDPDQGEGAYRLCLLRTLKTALHETGHVFSLAHCTAYACGMCGSNHREESDRRPLGFCPECLAKVCWLTGQQPQEHCERMAAFCAEHGLTREAEFYRAQQAALEKNRSLKRRPAVPASSAPRALR